MANPFDQLDGSEEQSPTPITPTQQTGDAGSNPWDALDDPKVQDKELADDKAAEDKVVNAIQGSKQKAEQLAQQVEEFYTALEKHTGISNRRSLNAYVATKYATGHLDELVSDLEIPPEVWQAVEGVVLAVVFLAVGATKKVGDLASYLASHAEIVLFLIIEYGPKVLGLGNLSDDEIVNAIGGEGAADRVKAARKGKRSWFDRVLNKIGLSGKAKGWLLAAYVAFKYRHELLGVGASLVEDIIPEETQEILKPLGDIVTGEKDIDLLGGIRDNQRKIDELIGPGPSKTTWWPFKAHGGLIGDDPMRQKFYAKGGKIGDKVSKIYDEGYTAPGQAYAIAKSKGYAGGGKVTGSLPMKDKFYKKSGR